MSRGIQLAHDRPTQLGIGERFSRARGLRLLELESARHPLVQEQLRRAHQRVAVEAPLPELPGERVGECDEAHADVVRHPGLDQRERLAGRGAGIVERLAKSVGPEGTELLQRGEIADRAPGRHEGRERRGVRRDHEVTSQPSLEREIRHAEGAVLIGVVPIPQVVRALAHAPRHPVPRGVRDLTPHGAVAGVVEHRAGEGAHHQGRHQVLEHASAPRHQRHVATGAGEGAAEAEPVLHRHLAAGHRHEAREAGLGGEEVVVRGIQRRRA